MRVFAYGRLHRHPSRTWERALGRNGDGRVRRIQDADLVVVGTGSAAKSPQQIWSDLDQMRSNAVVISERGFFQRLGLEATHPSETRPYTPADLAARSKQPISTVNLLAMFGVVDTDENGRFGFRAPKAVASAAALLGSGVALQTIVAASERLRNEPGVTEPLAEFNVTAEPGGRIVLRSGDQVSDLGGQLFLALQADSFDPTALLAEAAEAREAGQTELAVRLGRKALKAAPRDVDALFEVGSLLCETSECAEGIALLRRALKIDPSFADAFYNIGHCYQEQGRNEEARQAYEQAIAADPNYPDPLYNLGMMALDEQRFSEAVERLEFYLRFDGTSEWAGRARKAATLARMSQVKAAG